MISGKIREEGLLCLLVSNIDDRDRNPGPGRLRWFRIHGLAIATIECECRGVAAAWFTMTLYEASVVPISSLAIWKQRIPPRPRQR